jgi:parallel beta-helix repeat protein
LAYSHNSSISGNIINYNGKVGIQFIYSFNNTVLQNIMNECGIELLGFLSTNFIDTTNLVNGKPLYYYYEKINLEPENFTNAGQVNLVKCHNSLLSNLNISMCSYAITLNLCNNATISNNTVVNNIYGIYLGENCDSNNITRNNAEYNEYGISIGQNSNNNYLSGNFLNRNKVGIRLWDNRYNLILRNIVNYNSRGIILVGSYSNTIWENIANHNRNTGIYLDEIHYMHKGCIKNNISNNIAQYNEEGLFLGENCNENVISGNIVNYNSYHGIHLGLSDYNIISGNNASFNSQIGIYLDGSSFNMIVENNASHNGNGGIFLRQYYSSDLIKGSDHNTISENELIGNIYCIKIDSNSVDNILENNTCQNRQQSIPGYDIFLLFGILFMVLFIIIKKINRE